MRRSAWVRILAIVLVISMLAMPVSAAGLGGDSTNGGALSNLIGVIRDIIRDIIGVLIPGDPQPSEPIETTPPTEPVETTVPTEPVETEPVETEPEETQPEVTEPEVTEPVETEPEETEPEETPELILSMEEDHTNTVNSHLLRAVTYAMLTPVSEPAVSTYNLRSSSMLRSGMTALNSVGTNSDIQPLVEEDTTEFPTNIKSFTNWVNGGEYYIQSARAAYYAESDSVKSWLSVSYDETTGLPVGIVAVETQEEATKFTLTHNVNGSYELSVKVDGVSYFLYITGEGTDNLGFSTVHSELEIEDYTPVISGNDTLDSSVGNFLRIFDNNAWYLNQYGGRFSENYGGYDQETSSAGNALWFYQVSDSGVSRVTVSTKEDTSKLVYFPVTMFNYDGGTINAITDALDTNGTTVREGLYFSNGGSELGEVTIETVTDLSVYTDGNYYIQNLRAKDNNVSSWLHYDPNGDNNRYIKSTSQDNAQIWTLTNKGNNQVTLSYVENGTTYYMTVGDATSGVTTTETILSLEAYSHSTEGVQIKGTEYLCQFGSSAATAFGGYEESDDPGNGMAFYPLSDDGTVSTSPINNSVNTMTSGYEIWNWWAYKSNGHSAQNMAYTGLVQDQLDANGNIVFNVTEPGIFTDEVQDATSKQVYKYVGLPFTKNEKGYYTFDSDYNGVYFNGTPASGVEKAYNRLSFDYGVPQGWSGMQTEFGDGSYNLWAPYNTNANDTGASAIDYHFGMHAKIPFSMTSNGRLKEIDSNSEPITFTFAGDDDVWIFIDGKLVIDLGGIHNRLGATINFAENTITYFRPITNKNQVGIGSYNESDKYPVVNNNIVLKLFSDAEGTGVLGVKRDEFASDTQHYMDVFYLERGKGTSNCKIEFNLPMRDTLLITKDATKSWTAGVEGVNGDGTSPLTSKEQEIVNNMKFDFVLYRKYADEDTFSPVTNTRFYLQDAAGEVKDILATGVDGSFSLKNGETAKFMTDMPAEGVTYYVVEKAVPPGFVTPDFNYTGTSARGFDYTGTTLDADGNAITVSGNVANAADIGEQELPLDAIDNMKSYEVTGYGSIEAIDSLEIICTNYMDAKIPNPGAFANEDIIVIDYGLPVEIDPLANDLFRGESIEIVHMVAGDVDLTGGDGVITKEEGDALEKKVADINGSFGTFYFNDAVYSDSAKDTLRYVLNKQLTEVEVLTYVIKVYEEVTQTGTGTTNSDYAYSYAKLYVVPATIMYYEENFTDLVKFTDASGEFTPELKMESQYISAYQEPGVVGTIGDSTYGSDVAYRGVEGNENYPADSHDSNGTSYFFDTTNGYVRFQYTFTGTGTSFFARTSSKTGYMQVLLFEGALENAADHSGEQRDVWYRDTYWNDTNGYADDADGTLYNIPVFTEDGLPYGTYTMLVTVAAAGTQGAGPNLERSGNEFYLDGIRIMQPLNDVYGVDSETGEEYEKPVEELLPITVKALNAYATDGESNLDVVTLRQKLITDAEEGEAIWDGENFVVLTDTNGEITLAEEYKSIGPKEEVYLAPGQKVRFSLKYWQPEGLKLYIGMKAPFGSAALNVGSTAYTLRNAADCYYDVTDNYASLVELTDEEGYPYYVVTYTFEATDKIVSLTNIKVVGNYEFTIIENTNIEVDGDGIES